MGLPTACRTCLRCVEGGAAGTSCTQGSAGFVLAQGTVQYETLPHCHTVAHCTQALQDLAAECEEALAGAPPSQLQLHSIGFSGNPCRAHLHSHTRKARTRTHTLSLTHTVHHCITLGFMPAGQPPTYSAAHNALAHCTNALHIHAYGTHIRTYAHAAQNITLLLTAPMPCTYTHTHIQHRT